MESGLAVTKAELDDVIGFKLGYGRDHADWSEDEARTVADVLRTAQRYVYTPVIVPGRTETHSWSFLKLLSSLTLESAGTTVPLPADFQYLEGPVVNVGSNRRYPAVRLSAEARVKRNLLPDTTGFPQVAELEWYTPPDASRGQRARLHVWPTADAAYTLQLAYAVNPDVMADERPFSYGGAAHAETFRAACLAACEFYVMDERGKDWAYFQDQLMRSVSHDRKHKPEILGYVGDRGGRGGYYDGRPRGYGGVTYNGAAIT